jgi:hypothetical protein
MAKIGRVDLYEVAVYPKTGPEWMGLFNFKPNSGQVEQAICEDIAALDLEHELELADGLRQTLELVRFPKTELFGDVVIAGTAVGEITMAIVKSFGMVEEAMMPPLLSLSGTRSSPRLNVDPLDKYNGILTDPRPGEILPHLRGT